MRIQKELYSAILAACPIPPPEVGGLLGGQNNTATHFMLDRGLDSVSDRYVPDVISLNLIIAEWELQGIEFLGLFHTHYPGCCKLSDGDEIYIKAIITAMPERIHRLYFPLVFPGDQILSYVAERKSDGVCISEDTVELT